MQVKYYYLAHENKSNKRTRRPSLKQYKFLNFLRHSKYTFGILKEAPWVKNVIAICANIKEEPQLTSFALNKFDSISSVLSLLSMSSS